MGKSFGFISKTLGSKSSERLSARTNSPPAPAKTSYDITPEIQEILELVETGDGKVIFVTGAAGTGKSTLIDILRTETKKDLVVVAPTGLAAINIGGQTIHSFFQLAPEPQPKPRIIKGLNGMVIKNMDVLVIDEVSMVRADLMDSITESLRINTNNHQSPFAGKTVVFIGDMHQLPPVVATPTERLLFEERYASPYFFSAESLSTVKPTTKVLTTTFRQKDQEFVGLLNNIRVGKDLETTIGVLNARCYKTDGAAEAVMTLTTINAKADNINEGKLRRIDEPEFIYEAILEGDFGERENLLPAPRILELKVGAQVMFLRNHARWVNGTTGKILELDDESARVAIESGPFKGEVTVGKETWERVKYTWDNKRQKITKETVGKYTQLPFRLAWAVTIHKAQGLTLESVTIDLDRGTFEHGQAYVALSRCRTMEGLSLSRPLRVDDIKPDKSIIEFYSHLDIGGSATVVSGAEPVYTNPHKRTHQLHGRNEEGRQRDPRGLTAMRKKRPREYATWKQDEKDTLEREFNQGRTIRELAEGLQRTEGAVRSQLQKMGLQ